MRGIVFCVVMSSLCACFDVVCLGQQANSRFSAEVGRARNSPKSGRGVHRALLIGSSDCPQDGSADLRGPDNEFRFFRNIFVRKSGFRSDDKRMSDRGANVWLIADSRHNGTPTGGGIDIPRGIGAMNLTSGACDGGAVHQTRDGQRNRTRSM